MTKSQFEEFKKLQAQYAKACREIWDVATLIGADIGNKLRVAYKANFPEKYSEYQGYSTRWIKTYDYMEVSFDDDTQETYLEYWERGRCGNQEECLHSIKLTEALLAPNGAEEYVKEWVDGMQLQLNIDMVAKNAAKASKIEALQAEIESLRK